MPLDRQHRSTNPDPSPNDGLIRPRDPAGEMLERLLDLAHDVSSYLRHHQQATVRTATAVLLAASLAACGPSAPARPEQETIEPLAEEVHRGLPSGPGRYQVQAETLRRDSQGVYHFHWLQPGGPQQQATASLVRLVQGQTNELEMPASGDPILHLREDTPVALSDTPVDAAAAAGTPPGTPTSQSSGSSSRSYVPWYPFFGGANTSTPSYRNPPGTVENDTARGSTASSSPPPPAQRTSGIAHGVSGQAKGTGSGTAASGKSGAMASGVSGQAGGAGGGDAASSKGGSSSGAGVGAVRSGGFSGGGSSGGFSGGSSS